MAGPVLVLYGDGDAEWASCLQLDLQARKVDVTDGRAVQSDAVEPRALVVVRSWRSGGRVPPPTSLVAAVLSRNGHYIVARRDWTTYRHRGPDADLPGATHQFPLWNDYYQPYRRASGGSAGGGIGNLLDVLLRPGASIDLPDGYVFISYHHETDGSFVHERLRPLLSRAELTSWAYRTSERIGDTVAAPRLEELVEPRRCPARRQHTALVDAMVRDRGRSRQPTRRARRRDATARDRAVRRPDPARRPDLRAWAPTAPRRRWWSARPRSPRTAPRRRLTARSRASRRQSEESED